MAIGVLDGREDEKQLISYEQLLDSNLEKPYHARYFDEEDIHYFSTADELFNAPVYENESIKDRWNTVVIIRIGKRDMRLSARNKKQD